MITNNAEVNEAIAYLQAEYKAFAEHDASETNLKIVCERVTALFNTMMDRNELYFGSITFNNNAFVILFQKHMYATKYEITLNCDIHGNNYSVNVREVRR